MPSFVLAVLENMMTASRDTEVLERIIAKYSDDQSNAFGRQRELRQYRRGQLASLDLWSGAPKDRFRWSSTRG